MIILIKIILGVIVLGVLVLVHELGHFIAAKACKIRVLAFSIGFGKVLLHKTIGTTDYRLSAIPFGGYVKMAGEHPEEGAVTDQAPLPDEFPARPIWQRMVVAIAGPAANFITAMLMLLAMFLWWGEKRPSYNDRPVIGGIADSSAAQTAGLLTGDSIIAINGKPVRRWEDIDAVFMRLDKKYAVTVSRNSGVRTCELSIDQNGEQAFKYLHYGMEPPVPAVIGSVDPGSPADKAGLKAWDTIVAVGPQPVSFWSQISGLVQSGRDGKGIVFTVDRNNARITFPVSPNYLEKEKRWIVGIRPGWEKSETIRYPAGMAWQKCRKETWRNTTLIFVYLSKLIKRELSWKLMSGPVGIVAMSGSVAFLDFGELLKIMAMIGINLAVINLFPLIITDGGMLLFLCIEAIRRKPLQLKTQIIITNIGIAFIITLFLLVLSNDIRNLPMYFSMFLKG